MKTAKIIPIFKKVDTFEVDHYWRISLLSAIFKVIEKLVAKTIISFLDNNSLSNQRHGFKKQILVESATAEKFDFIET